MRALRMSRVLTVVTSTVLVGGLTLVGAGAAYADGHSDHQPGNGRVIYVSNGTATAGSSHDRGCATAQFSTIQAGVNAASPGQAVVVCPGHYTEDVLVQQPLRLLGQGAVIDATGLRNGVVIASSNVLLQGFTVTGALSEGILAEPPGAVTNPMPPTTAAGTLAPVSNVNIAHNVAINNNTGGNPQNHQCPETPAPPLFLYPGDCGGGIHLDTVSNSQVQGNSVTGNDDGILITDDYGPAFKNLVTGNYVANNLYECGIVLPSHNAFSVTATPKPDGTYTLGALTPSTGGVFQNFVIGNAVIGNGTFPNPQGGGSGSGVGVFAPSAGTAAYQNTVAYNFISGNGQAGFTIHAHYPGGQYVGGNRVVSNTFGPNNAGGDFLDGPGTDPDTSTTAILVFSAVPVTMVIADNHIYGNTTGIWLTPSVQAAGLHSNSIVGATTPIYISSVPYAFTGPAIDMTAATATVGVLITANGSPTTYYVEYGTSTTYTSKTAVASAGSGVLPAGYPVPLAGVTAGQTIHYQVVATNANGTRSGGDMTFTAS